ncbi:pro-adrenomedullin [Ornithorhynchus anatinus]|uniref:Pro-adrenomedullin n=1 Tax=Ornithorhynchus anatinus TaxID=9258 RepID=A0A6I8NUQ0_ORNAN|nr:pro-adrenomedullin [Ornithorhynchus anatinus]
MRLIPVALVYLGALSFLAVDSAPLDVASEFRKKWNKWALKRGKRELRAATSPPIGAVAEAAAAGPVETFIRPLDVKGSVPGPQSRSSDASRIRVKRYRQSMNGFPHFQGLRLGCRFGTCTVQKLAHQIYQLTDKDKDGTAPASKISPQGYGRRRRRRALSGTSSGRPRPPLQDQGLQLQEEKLQLREPLRERLQLQQEKLQLQEPLRERLQLQKEKLQLQERLQGTVPSPMALRLRGDLGGGGGRQTSADA